MSKGVVQTVQYSRQGKLIEIDAEVRIWVNNRVCLILSPESKRMDIAVAATDPPLQSGSFNIIGVADISEEGFAEAFARAAKVK